MKSNGIHYEFSAIVWHSATTGGWYFVSLPLPLAKAVRNNFKHDEEGWGRLKVTAKIGHSEWTTALWFDSKRMTYLLPLKAAVRKRERLDIDNEVNLTIWV